MRVIALEEAFLHPKLREHYPPSYVKSLDMVKVRLGDVGPERIRRMDAAGVDLQVLSHVAPGVQTLEDASLSIRLSKEVNDWLGDVVRQYPTRFAGFALLPTQSPQDAADELERTVTQFGFKGAMVNGHMHGRFLDDLAFSPILERAAALDVPIYIHPYTPPQGIMDIYYRDCPHMVQGWGWQVDTGTHLLRMIASGVFDRYPNLKVIIGHMGELIPFGLDRINRQLTMVNWLLSSGPEGAGTAAHMEKNLLYYMRNNVFITSSGVFDQVALNCAIGNMGIDNVMFSIDDPFADNIEGMEFLRNADLSQADKEKFAHGNAERILKFSTAVHPRKSTSSALDAFLAKAKSRVAQALLSFLLK
ncbi:amidohydrolase family protein [Dyella tabacisoli]|nr:amidohydrolase family protein [Dyella tabacisoli]